MSQASLCAGCDRDLPVDSPAGLCPACLIGMTLAETRARAGDLGNDRTEPDAEPPGRMPGSTTCPRVAPDVPPLHASRPSQTTDADTFATRYEDPSPTDPPTGRRDNAGPLGYTILERLGAGGMGVVYKARQEGLDRLVALKMIRDEAHARPVQLERFRIEAQAVARLRHPNIVQIFDVGESDGAPYFSLELLEGGSLADRIAGTPQGPRAAAELVATLSLAVHEAHLAGIVHRDLKPQNVLFGLDGVPRVTDFGLAKRLEAEDGPTLTE